jgi:MFS family permease
MRGISVVPHRNRVVTDGFQQRDLLNASENPLDWSKSSKWTVTLLVSIFSFVTLASSTMIAPALSDIAIDLNVSSDDKTQIAMSVFILSWGLGPLFWGPLSEEYGRKRILLGSNIVFLVFNVLSGFCRSIAELTACRCISGFGASASVAVSRMLLQAHSLLTTEKDPRRHTERLLATGRTWEIHQYRFVRPAAWTSSW